MADIVGMKPVTRSGISLVITRIRGTLKEGYIPIDILLRIHSFCHAPLVLGTDMTTQWELNQDPADGFVYIELSDLCYYLFR